MIVRLFNLNYLRIQITLLNPNKINTKYCLKLLNLCETKL